MFVQILEHIGQIYILILIYKLGKFLRDVFSKTRKIPDNFGKGWAVISGGSDGIGKGFCEELISRGYNICLICRNQLKGEGVLKELRQLNPQAKTKLVLADYSKSTDPDFIEKMKKDLQELKNEVAILVNNAGIDNLCPFDTMNFSAIKEIINVNVTGHVLLTRFLLPQMLERKQRGIIINLASIAGDYPFPMAAIYSATKRFNNMFSCCLATEVSSQIETISIKPLYVTTKMTRYQKGNGAISPRKCAWGTMQQISQERSSNGHFFHRIQHFVVTNFLPHFLGSLIVKNLVLGPLYYKRLNKQKQIEKKLLEEQNKN